MNIEAMTNEELQQQLRLCDDVLVNGTLDPAPQTLEQVRRMADAYAEELEWRAHWNHVQAGEDHPTQWEASKQREPHMNRSL